MRLIDADELLEHYACDDVTGIPEEDIRLAPTLEVIPIEWIEKSLLFETLWLAFINITHD